MPKVRRSKSRKPPPSGFDDIESTLEEFTARMREAENNPHEGKRRTEMSWEIFKIHHQRSRYVYDLFYRRKQISRELYDYLLREGYADANLIAKWKKPGYENLCCLRCIQSRDTNYGTTCVCRVPQRARDGEDEEEEIGGDGVEGKRAKGKKTSARRIIECVHCGCRGCSG